MQSPIKLTADASLPLSKPASLLTINYPPGKKYKDKFVGDKSYGNFELTDKNPPAIDLNGRAFRLSKSTYI